MNQVDFIEALVVARPLDIQNGNNVLMVEIPQQLHLTQCPQAEHGMVERRDLLDGNFLARGFVDSGAEHDQISFPPAG